MSSHNDRLPESQEEWLATGKFEVDSVRIDGRDIRYALTKGLSGGRLVVMVGGIPREAERRAKLPVINKLYGQLALLLERVGVSSLLYNQPGTGGSGGDWDTETLESRTSTLAELVHHFSTQMSSSEYGLVGSSAGAYMAINAIEQIRARKHEVSRLLLLSPAAYPEGIERVPYGENFSRILRQPWDAATSPVFTKLRKHLGDKISTLLCFFEDDDPPIPWYIQEHYRNLVREFAKQEPKVSSLTIPGVAHNFRRLEKKRGSAVDDESIKVTAEKFAEFLS